MGSYPLEFGNREIERLRVQSAAVEPAARELLGLIGVGEGWRCVDLGCGPMGVAPLIAERVGTTGSVVGVDFNPAYLEIARERARMAGLSNLEFRHGDVFKGVAWDGFDLVHLRFVASTAGSAEGVIQEAVRLARPGGIVALQEPDGTMLQCYPENWAWERLRNAWLDAFAGVGADMRLGRRLYSLARAAGLVDVQFRSWLLAVRSGDPMTDYLPSTVESLRGTVIRLGLIGETEFDGVIEECRRHLREPDTSFTMYAVTQVWGRKVGEA